MLTNICIGILYPIGKVITYEAPVVLNKGVDKPITNLSPFQKFIQDKIKEPSLKKKNSKKVKLEDDMDVDQNNANPFSTGFGVSQFSL